ncbi:MAG: hypothetical protein ACK41V_23745, partial [Acidovorax sp.]
MSDAAAWAGEASCIATEEEGLGQWLGQGQGQEQQAPLRSVVKPPPPAPLPAPKAPFTAAALPPVTDALSAEAEAEMQLAQMPPDPVPLAEARGEDVEEARAEQARIIVARDKLTRAIRTRDVEVIARVRSEAVVQPPPAAEMPPR